VRFEKFTFGEDLKIYINFHNTLFFNEISCALSKAFETMRFTMRSQLNTLITLPVLGFLIGLTGCVQPSPHAGQGILVGEVTETSALVQVRLSVSDALENNDLEGVEGAVEFVLVNLDNNSEVARTNIKAAGFRDCILRARFLKSFQTGPGIRFGRVLGKTKEV
jgi:hypothetical protein